MIVLCNQSLTVQIRVKSPDQRTSVLETSEVRGNYRPENFEEKKQILCYRQVTTNSYRMAVGYNGVDVTCNGSPTDNTCVYFLSICHVYTVQSHGSKFDHIKQADN